MDFTLVFIRGNTTSQSKNAVLLEQAVSGNKLPMEEQFHQCMSSKHYL